MIDPRKEKLIPLRIAAELYSLSYGTLRNHAFDGWRGVQLETFTIGAKTLTSVQAVNRFSKKCAKIREADLAREKENRETAAADAANAEPPLGIEEVPR